MEQQEAFVIIAQRKDGHRACVVVSNKAIAWAVYDAFRQKLGNAEMWARFVDDLPAWCKEAIEAKQSLLL